MIGRPMKSNLIPALGHCDGPGKPDKFFQILMQPNLRYLQREHSSFSLQVYKVSPCYILKSHFQKQTKPKTQLNMFLKLKE